MFITEEIIREKNEKRLWGKKNMRVEDYLIQLESNTEDVSLRQERALGTILEPYS